MGGKVFFEQVGMLAVLATFVTDAATANRNPKAEEVARTMMQAMGGQRAWDSLILFGSISRLPGTEKAGGAVSRLGQMVPPLSA